MRGSAFYRVGDFFAGQCGQRLVRDERFPRSPRCEGESSGEKTERPFFSFGIGKADDDHRVSTFAECLWRPSQMGFDTAHMPILAPFDRS